MRSEVGGFVVGVAVVAVTDVVGQLRRDAAARAVSRRVTNLGLVPAVPGDQPPTPPRRIPDWDDTMPLPRSALRPRWEWSSEVIDDDDWLESLLVWSFAIVIGVAWIATTWSIVHFAAYVLVGLTFAFLGLGVRSWVLRRPLPPGARQVMVRGLVVLVVCTAALMWVSSTRYRLVSLDAVQAVIGDAKFTDRPGMLTRSLHASGWTLAVVLGAGVTFAVAGTLIAMIDLVAMFAVVKLGEGSRRPFIGWTAQFYPRRQLRWWVSLVVISVIAFLLTSGNVLQWWDKIDKDTPLSPTPASTTIPGSVTTAPLRPVVTTTPTTIAIGGSSSTPAASVDPGRAP